MAADGELGYGTKFQTGNGSSPETFTDLAFVTSITAPNLSRDSIDVSHMQSPDEWREFIAGMKDAGEVSLELNFKAGGTAFLAMLAELNTVSASATKTRRITWPTGSYMEFEAMVETIKTVLGDEIAKAAARIAKKAARAAAKSST